jgi:hypothetical protein
MKNRGLIIAAGVLAALLGLLYWSNRHKPSETIPASATPSEPAPKILTLNEGDITKIELKKKGDDQIVLAKDSGGKWHITAPKSLGVDQSAVTVVLSTVSSLNSERLVEEKATNLRQYGLSEPALQVEVTDKNNTTHKLLVGDDNPTGSGAYIRLDGDSRVFTIAGYTKTSIDKHLNDLRDKRLITFDADKISRLELIAKKQDIEFGRDKDRWQILKPKPLRTDGTKVDELVRKLTDAKMDVTESTDTAKAASAFASGAAIATATVTTDAGTQQIKVRKDKDEYYAKSSVADGVYKITSDLGQALDEKLDDFRKRTVFDFGLNDPGKIEIHDGSKTYLLTKSGEDWWSADGKRVDKSSAEALVDKLRKLQATAFADSGFGNTLIDITVTANDGKRLERVLFSMANKKPLAKRESEPSLYVLDSSVVEDLQKLVNDLKTNPTSGN